MTHKTVPREPTPEMMDVYRAAFTSTERFDGAKVWAAMWDAAPTPEPLSMSMFASKADYDAAVKAQAPEPPGMAEIERAQFPACGRFSLQELADAVDMAAIGSTGHTKPDSGHDSVPFINFNSLNRIVTHFAALAQPRVPEGVVVTAAQLKRWLVRVRNPRGGLTLVNEEMTALLERLDAARREKS